MQELNKILEEISVDEAYLTDWYINSVDDSEPLWTEAHISELYSDFVLIPKGITKKYAESDKDSNVPTNDGWIPVEERLPEEKINPANQDFYEYQVTAKFGNVKDVRHYKYGNGHWWHGPGIVDKYVTAWKERPEPYQPDKEQERTENIKGGRFEKVE